MATWRFLRHGTHVMDYETQIYLSIYLSIYETRGRTRTGMDTVHVYCALPRATVDEPPTSDADACCVVQRRGGGVGGRGDGAGPRTAGRESCGRVGAREHARPLHPSSAPPWRGRTSYCSGSNLQNTRAEMRPRATCKTHVQMRPRRRLQRNGLSRHPLKGAQWLNSSHSAVESPEYERVEGGRGAQKHRRRPAHEFAYDIGTLKNCRRCTAFAEDIVCRPARLRCVRVM